MSWKVDWACNGQDYFIDWNWSYLFMIYLNLQPYKFADYLTHRDCLNDDKLRHEVDLCYDTLLREIEDPSPGGGDPYSTVYLACTWVRRYMGMKYQKSLWSVWGPFYWHWLTSIPAWISSHILNKVWDEITYPLSNFITFTVEVWEGLSNFIPHFIMDVITSPCWD